MGQCAHQSLSSTATPELDMIPIRNKGTLADSQIAKDITRNQPSQHSWVYQDAKEVERLSSKLVSSTTELWTPAPDLSWLLKHLHTQHKEASPSMLHSPSGYASPFQCYSGCAKKKTGPLDLSMRFLLTLVLSN